MLVWPGSVAYDYGAGPLANLGTYTTTSAGTNQGPASSFSTAADNPAVDGGFWYLFRVASAAAPCNAPSTYGSPERDAAAGLP